MHPRHQDKLNLDGGGFHETRPKLPRTRRPLLKGSASASGISVAPPPSQPRRQRAVFVTRLGPNCDAASLKAHIEQSGTLTVYMDPCYRLLLTPEQKYRATLHLTKTWRRITALQCKQDSTLSSKSVAAPEPEDALEALLKEKRLRLACTFESKIRRYSCLPPEEVESRALPPDPAEEIFKARHYRRAYLLATANPLLTPFPPSQLFSRRQLVTLRQIQTGIILAPYLLQRFRQHSSSHREKGSGAATTNLPCTCALCHKNADLEHLLWDSPLYSEPRTRTLATILQSLRHTSLHDWACPDPSFPKLTAIELWRSLLAYIQDPAAPHVGTRLQGTQLFTTQPRQKTKPKPTAHLSSDAVAPTGPTSKNGGPLSPAPVP
ncbi:hypothetical protein HPB47_005557 [Ixodes persulcatus]|uniref:Uncharacterized protein n=1 Tax=Ixodes persulcatus TaxID=34615 RepID=A0AC60PDL9_IXOPE|nr:hypothetical protein HPB47_005557 [Ixodes persulcatus]